ncbi:hypothetical protein [Paenibacillus silviterrae]
MNEGTAKCDEFHRRGSEIHDFFTMLSRSRHCISGSAAL